MAIKKKEELKAGSYIQIPEEFTEFLESMLEDINITYSGIEAAETLYFHARKKFWKFIHTKYPELKEYNCKYMKEERKIFILYKVKDYEG